MINHTVSARHLAIGLAASIPSPVQALHFLVISGPSARLGFWQHMFTVSGTRQLMYPDTNKASTQHGILSTVVLLCSQLHAPHAAVPHMSGLLYGLTTKPPNMPLTAPSHRMAPTCQRQCSPSPPQWRSVLHPAPPQQLVDVLRHQHHQQLTKLPVGLRSAGTAAAHANLNQTASCRRWRGSTGMAAAAGN